MHPFSISFQGIEKGCTGKEWVNDKNGKLYFVCSETSDLEDLRLLEI